VKSQVCVSRAIAPAGVTRSKVARRRPACGPPLISSSDRNTVRPNVDSEWSLHRAYAASPQKSKPLISPVREVHRPLMRLVAVFARNRGGHREPARHDRACRAAKWKEIGLRDCRVKVIRGERAAAIATSTRFPSRVSSTRFGGETAGCSNVGRGQPQQDGRRAPRIVMLRTRTPFAAKRSPDAVGKTSVVRARQIP